MLINAPAYVKFFDRFMARHYAVYRKQVMFDERTGQRLDQWLYQTGDDVAWNIVSDYTQSEWAMSHASRKLIEDHGLSISFHAGTPAGCVYFRGEQLVAYALGSNQAEALRKATLRLIGWLDRQN